MSPKENSKSRAGHGSAESLSVQIDRALASLGEAEMNLTNLRSSRLSEMARTLATAASEIESLHSSMSTAEPDKRTGATLRAPMQKLRYASSRVCALYGAARRFHAGLALVRRMEAGAYDARGEVCGTSAGCLFPHRLETQG
jgi:hypothetical protein